MVEATFPFLSFRTGSNPTNLGGFSLSSLTNAPKFTATFATVPEPSSFSLLGVGVVGLDSPAAYADVGPSPTRIPGRSPASQNFSRRSRFNSGRTDGAQPRLVFAAGRAAGRRVHQRARLHPGARGLLALSDDRAVVSMAMRAASGRDVINGPRCAAPAARTAARCRPGRRCRATPQPQRPFDQTFGARHDASAATDSPSCSRSVRANFGVAGLTSGSGLPCRRPPLPASPLPGAPWVIERCSTWWGRQAGRAPSPSSGKLYPRAREIRRSRPARRAVARRVARTHS